MARSVYTAKAEEVALRRREWSEDCAWVSEMKWVVVARLREGMTRTKWRDDGSFAPGCVNGSGGEGDGCDEEGDCEGGSSVAGGLCGDEDGGGWDDDGEGMDRGSFCGVNGGLVAPCGGGESVVTCGGDELVAPCGGGESEEEGMEAEGGVTAGPS